MTREEVYEEFKAEWNEFLKGTGLTDPNVREKHMSNNEDLRRVVECNEYILNMFKQESILDKIRAEIQKLRNCSCSCSDGIIDDVEDILDKYKAESKPQERGSDT